jgi:NAD+ diphosphatase
MQSNGGQGKGLTQSMLSAQGAPIPNSAFRKGIMKNDHSFISAVVPPEERAEPAWWFAFLGNQLLLHQDPDSIRVPYLREFSELGVPHNGAHYLGELDGHSCYAVDLEENADVPKGMALEGLRKVYNRLDEELFWLAARAVQIVDWGRTQRFCGRCGVPLKARETAGQECPQCGLLHSPPGPGGDRPGGTRESASHGPLPPFCPGVYSVLAGFVEPGRRWKKPLSGKCWKR